MPTPKRSLNDQLPWVQVLDALDLHAETTALPSWTACPTCSDRLMILQDHLSGGQWNWCRKCHQAGDMVELASRTWKLTIPASVAKLQSLGLPIVAERAEVDTYVQQHVKRRADIAEFWDQSSARYVHSSTDIGRLIHEFNLGCDVSYERLANGMGRIIGISDRDKASRLIRPGEVRNKGKVFKNGNTHDKWGNILAIPFYDLPNRICSFLFIGRKGRPNKDFVFQHMNLSTLIGRQMQQAFPREGGLSMHPDIYQASIAWGKTIMVVPDPLRALQIHARHFLHSTKPLPLIGWFSESPVETTKAWDMFVNRRLIMWAPQLTWQILRQAIRTGARISLAGPREDSKAAINQYMYRMSPEDLLDHVRRESLPWPQALAKHCENLCENELEGLLLEMQLGGTNMQRVLQHCPKALSERISLVLNHRSIGRTIVNGSKTITERDGGWYAQAGRGDAWEEVLSAQLRLDYLIPQQATGTMLCRGRVIKNGKAYEFCVDAKVLQRDPVGVINDTLAKAKLNVGLATRWANRLIEIAQAFQAPKTAPAAEIVGWDPERLAFVLPSYQIQVGGEVVGNKGMTPVGSPGEYFARPEVLSGQELAPLMKAANADVIWACVSSLLANILSTAFHRNPSGIGTVGDSITDAMGVIAVDCGCMSYATRDGHLTSATEFERLKAMERSHRWPVHVGLKRMSTHLARFIDMQDVLSNHRNCVVGLSWYAGAIKKMHGGWQILEHPEPVELTKDIREALRRLIPCYLLDLAKRRLELIHGAEGPTWWGSLLDDLAAWAKRLGMDPAPIFLSQSIVSPSRACGSAEAVADLTAQWAKEGKWDTVPGGFEAGDKPELIRVDQGRYREGALLIPKKGFADLAAKHARTVLDLQRVSAALQAGESLLEDGEDFWAVSEAWWLSRLRESQNARTGLLRLRA